jgi:CheY-like chemotaxis protein
MAAEITASNGIIADALEADRGRRKTILVVDDSPELLTTVSALLQDAGFKVLTAVSGLEAVSLFLAGQIDCVVLDYNMPDIDGAILAERLKFHNYRLPIIMFSGAETLPKSALKNVDALVQKGESGPHLLQVVQDLLPR